MYDGWATVAHAADTLPGMSRPLLERRLKEVAERLTGLRRELAVVDEQQAALADQADDARLRALVSETPLAAQQVREAHRHVEAMGRHRADLADEIARLERDQDDLLDRLYGGG